MSQQTQTRQTALPYSKEKVTRWLVFLARGMTVHDQTIFLIENLQPSWLLPRRQYWIYILISRLIYGVLYGLIISLTFDMSYYGSVYYGLAFGNVVGIIEFALITHSHLRDTPNRSSFFRSLYVILPFAVMLYVMGMVISFVELIVLLNIGILPTLGWFVKRTNLNPASEVRTKEVIHFRFDSEFFINFYGVFIVVFGLVLNTLAIEAKLAGLAYNALWSIWVFIAGLLACLCFSMLLSIKFRVIDLKTTANQGIWLTLGNSGLIGAVSGVAILTLSVAVDGWETGLFYGLAGGLYVSLWVGGLDVIQHFLVRFLLWRSGSLPWRLAPFLDYAAEELHFLQKVGGGYIFVHRYLLEHFAAMEGEEKK